MIESENIVKAVHWLSKFRVRITLVLLFPLLCAVGVYFFSDHMLRAISIPLKGQQLFFMTPVEGIMAKIKIALFGGVAVSLPILAYIIVSMFGNMLPKKTRRIIFFLIIPLAAAALAGGIAFAYRLILPTTIGFLLSSGSGFMVPMISGSDYVSFTAFFLLAVGLVFELPLVLIALSRIGIITSGVLSKKRRIAILAIFIILAILTPTPDVFTLLATALPVVFLYEASVWGIFVLERLDRKNSGKLPIKN